MKLLKIGSSAACDIVINSPYVSGHHADVTILDNGDIILEDKGSRNGTFVGPQDRKLIPGTEEKVRRGDKIRFGDANLQWNLIPTPERNDNYIRVTSLGSGFRNDRVIGNSAVSRYHASIKVDKSKKAYIVDNGSTNGTLVNGIKIAPGKPVRIKHGDNIVLGNADITSQVQDLIPKRGVWLKWAGGIAAFVAVAACVFFAIGYFLKSDPNPKDSVVYVLNNYHYTITLKDNPLNVPLQIDTESFIAQGTAFHIDGKGSLGTARHVAMPWMEEYSPEEIAAVKKTLFDKVDDALISQDNLRSFLLNDEIGRQIYKVVNNWTEARTVLNAIQNGAIVVSGKSDDILIGYPGRKYTHFSDFDRATLIAESKTADKDVAILQLNKMKTPEFDSCTPLSIDKIRTDKLDPMKDELITVGYPAGIARATDDYDKQMQPTIYTSKVSKEPSRYTFELATAAAGGASGSPVYDKSGNLVGVVSASYSGNGATTFVVLAKYLKELYDNEVR